MTGEPSQLTVVERQVNALISQAEADLQGIYNAANEEAKYRMLMFRADLTGVLSNLNIKVSDPHNPVAHDEQANHIISLVADYFGVSTASILGRNRERRYAIPRQVAIYLIYRFIPVSSTWLSNFFDNRDHTTIISARQRVESAMKTDGVVRQALGVLERQINAQPVARKPNPRKGKRASTEHVEKIRRGVQVSREWNSGL